MKRQISDHWFLHESGMYYFAYYFLGCPIRTSPKCYETLEEAKKAYEEFRKCKEA